MNTNTFDGSGAGARHPPGAGSRLHRPGEYIGTTWRPASLSAAQVRWVLQALLLGMAFLLLMSFYTVVRGAVARGPIVAVVPAMAGVAPPTERECDPASQSGCARTPEDSAATTALPRLVSFEPR